MNKNIMNYLDKNNIFHNSKLKRSNFRKEMLTSEITKVFFYLWVYKIKNPILKSYSPYMVEVSPGCEHVKFILFEPSLIKDAEEKEKIKIKRALKRVEKWFRLQMSKLIQIRKVPEIKFHSIPRYGLVI